MSVLSSPQKWVTTRALPRLIHHHHISQLVAGQIALLLVSGKVKKLRNHANLIITAGTLGFYLNGTAYPNGSTVLRTDIGQGADALQCTTDNITCCTDATGEMLAGEFYSQTDGNMVPKMDDSMPQSDYYRTRGSGHILLNRRKHGNTTNIVGQFRCSIPNASGIMVNLYINIGEHHKILTIPKVVTQIYLSLIVLFIILLLYTNSEWK
jgi:hypothetical protein